MSYDRTTLEVNDLLTANVTVRNRTREAIFMPLIDLGIPPGFELHTDSIEDLTNSAKIARYEITGNQLILYMRDLPPDRSFAFSYRLRAKYPLRIAAPTASIYDYYNPGTRAETTGEDLHVR